MNRCAFVSLLFSILFCLSIARHVEVDIIAPWNQFPSSFITEIGELLSEESSEKKDDLYWQYLDEMCSHLPSVHDQLQMNNIAMGIALSLLPSSLHSLAETKLGLNYFAPAVEFYKSLGQPFVSNRTNNLCLCDNSHPFIVTPSNEIFCSLADYEKATETSFHSTLVDPLLQPPRNNEGNSIKLDYSNHWDHIYSSDTAGLDVPQKHVVLYGTYSSALFCEWYAELKLWAEERKIKSFSVRPSFHATAPLSAVSPLQGYGVFLDIKNMEYKNVDESTSGAGSGDDSAKPSRELKESFAFEEEIQGINFAKLFQQNPALEDEIAVLRETLAASNKGIAEGNDLEKMKVWKMKDFGVQFLQLTSAIAAKETSFIALTKGKEWVQNFPKFASMISSTKVKSSIKTAVQTLYRHPMINTIPVNSLFINHKRIELGSNTFNIYDLLSVIQEEIIAVNRFKSLKLPSVATQLLKSAVVSLQFDAEDDEEEDGFGGPMGEISPTTLEKDIIRIDVSKGGKHVVQFINNLEKDRLYTKTLQWPKSVTTLLYPSWNLHTVAKNLYTLILHVDVLSSSFTEMIGQLKMLYQENFPVRFGIAPFCGVSWKLDDISRTDILRIQLCRLYSSFLSSETNSGSVVLEAVTFLENVGQAIQDEGADVIDLERIISIYLSSTNEQTRRGSKAISDYQKLVADWKHRLLETDEFLDFVRNSTLYYKDRNVPLNSYSFNGIIVADDVSITNTLMRMIGREQYLLSQYVRLRLITDRTKSIFAEIMKITKAFPRYHPLLEEKKPSYLPLVPLGSGQQLIERALLSLPFAAKTFYAPFVPLHITADTISAFQPSHTLFAVLPLSKEGLLTLISLLEWQSREVHPTTSITTEDDENAHPALSSNTQISVIWNPSGFLVGNVEQDVGAEELKVVNGGEFALVYEELFAYLVGHNRVSNKLCSKLCTELMRVFLNSFESETAKVEWLIERGLIAVSAQVQATPITAFQEFDREELLSFIVKLRESWLPLISTRLALLKGNYSQIVGLFQLQSSETPYSALPKSEGWIIFNNRKLSIALDTFHPSDIELLYEIETKKIGKKTVQQLFHELERPKGKAEQTISSLQDFTERYYLQSFQRFLLLNFLWDSAASPSASSSSPSQTTRQHKFDFQQILNGIFPPDDPQSGAMSSTLVYQVEPELSSTSDHRYWDNANDLTIIMIFDPLSLSGQRGFSLIDLFREQLHFSYTVMLLPKYEITEFPLQQFYRFVLSSSSRLSELLSSENSTQTSSSSQEKALFSNLPRQHVLTTRVDIPELWNVQTMRSVQDIDNLQCTAQSCGDPDHRKKDFTSISYLLKSLLVTGQCFQATEVEAESSSDISKIGSPPNGLQLTLSLLTSSHTQELPLVSDTLVMQNLGYYQLQSHAPSLYLLSLSSGRSSYLFRIKDEQLIVKGGEAGTSSGKVVAIKAFNDRINRLIVLKRSGREHLSLLDSSDVSSPEDGTTHEQAEEDGKGFWENLKTSIFGSPGENEKSLSSAQQEEDNHDDKDDTIHIFSLATGHLYERFLRIMMLSVIKSSSMKIKFWLFENYLSPKFKEMASVMAAKYNFEVGYVTYKWPQWLRQQTQQQRIIWGYKILFLDVLFPLHVKKVIYVDADQVVRADLKELWTLDLQGAPYGYTPFCTSREETLGFQFWRSGYWKEHLQGKPYHISALYVVDLQTFRRHMVGDQLRAVYDQLSRDPNSLANLDQDLPNYAQHQVPIFSLPQQWLWCETWCSDKSKSKAKTIDLCNNPLHKEPKLDMAKRIISGKLFNQSWIELDDEIASLVTAISSP